MAVQWQNKSPKLTIAHVYDPTFKLPPTALELGDAFKELLRAMEKSGVAAEQMSRVRMHINKILSELAAKTNIWTITVGQAAAVQKSKSFVSEGQARDGIATLRRAIGYKVLGSLEAITSPVSEGIAAANIPDSIDKMKVKAGILANFMDDFPEVIIASRVAGGRFAALRIKIFDQARTAPPGEYRVIEPTEELIADKKARSALMQSMIKFFESTKMPWTIIWSPGRKVFLVIRTADLKSMRNGGN